MAPQPDASQSAASVEAAAALYEAAAGAPRIMGLSIIVFGIIGTVGLTLETGWLEKNSDFVPSNGPLWFWIVIVLLAFVEALVALVLCLFAFNRELVKRANLIGRYPSAGMEPSLENLKQTEQRVMRRAINFLGIGAVALPLLLILGSL